MTRCPVLGSSINKKIINRYNPLLVKVERLIILKKFWGSLRTKLCVSERSFKTPMFRWIKARASEKWNLQKTWYSNLLRIRTILSNLFLSKSGLRSRLGLLLAKISMSLRVLASNRVSTSKLPTQQAKSLQIIILAQKPCMEVASNRKIAAQLIC